MRAVQRAGPAELGGGGERLGRLPDTVQQGRPALGGHGVAERLALLGTGASSCPCPAAASGSARGAERSSRRRSMASRSPSCRGTSSGASASMTCSAWPSTTAMAACTRSMISRWARLWTSAARPPSRKRATSSPGSGSDGSAARRAAGDPHVDGLEVVAQQAAEVARAATGTPPNWNACTSSWIVTQRRKLSRSAPSVGGGLVQVGRHHQQPRAAGAAPAATARTGPARAGT